MAKRTHVYIETFNGPAAEMELTRRGGNRKVVGKEKLEIPGNSSWDGELGPHDTISIKAVK